MHANVLVAHEFPVDIFVFIFKIFLCCVRLRHDSFSVVLFLPCVRNVYLHVMPCVKGCQDV